VVLFAHKAGALEESRPNLEKDIIERAPNSSPTETETRYNELQLLHELSRAVLSCSDIQSILAAALKDVLITGLLDIGNIRLFNGSGDLEYTAYLGYRDQDNTRRHRSNTNAGSGGILVPRVVATKRSEIVTDISAVEGLRTFKAEGVKSAILVPIATDTEFLGIIEVGSRTLREFRAEEVRLLESMAAQVAVAVQKARLFADAQRRQEEHAAINDIAMATTESLHVDELLKIALAKVLEVTGRERGSIKLKDAETGKIVLAAHQGMSEKYAKTIRGHLAPEEKAAQIFESGEVIIVHDPEKTLFNASDREAGLRSLVWVPLKARGEVIGILNVSTRQTQPFTAREIELLKSIGHVVGIAVQNARLFEETDRRAREQAALYAVTAAVGSSFDLDQTLAKALETVLEATGMDAGYIYLLDGDSSRIMLKAHRGMSEAFISRMEHEQVGPKTAQIVRTKEPLILEDIPAAHEGRFKGEHITAAAWVPIVSKNIVVGILTVCTKNNPTFPRVQIPLLSSIGSALGVALENARLFQETDKHLKRLQALREIDRAISSTLDLNAVLSILLEKIDNTLPYASATIRLMNRSGVLEPVACRNLDEAEWKTEQSGRGIPNAVFETKAPVVIRDVRKDARAIDLDFYRRHNLVSYVGVPLTGKDEIIGVLGFYTKEEHNFTPEEIDFLATLAGQAAIAIQNSQLYEEARLREAQLKHANKIKDEFLSIMSHELRTPLNVVIGYAGLIREGMLGPTNAEQTNALDKLVSRTSDLLSMITSMLHAASIEANEVRLECIQVDMLDLLDECKLYYAEPLSKPVVIEWDFPADLPVVVTDPEKLRCILQNLIGNAIKFTEKGHISVSARVAQESQDYHPASQDCWVEYTVADTGVGIEADKLSVIFEKFRQADSSETRQYGGVGLGLYIAKKFTELLGGKIFVETEVGRGTTFTLRLPFNRTFVAASVRTRPLAAALRSIPG
jgi:GAF domain-containing protein